jgi:hypothetical protein
MSKEKSLILMQLAGESTAENSLSDPVEPGGEKDGKTSAKKKEASGLDNYEVFQSIGEGAFG